MKIRINKNVIAKLNPCQPRFDNYLKHYSDFNDDILKFLDLKNISFAFKLWVTLHVIPRHLVEVFAIDCAFAAREYVTDMYYFDHYSTEVDVDYPSNGACDAYDAAYYASFTAVTDDKTSNTIRAAHAAVRSAARSTANWLAAIKTEEKNQIKVLKYLIKGGK